MASYGIAGLMAAAIGAKFAKGALGGLLKFAIPLVLVVGAALFKFGRQIFGGES